MLLFAATLALEQLSVGVQVATSAFQIAFGACCLALAIAFGLGEEGWAASVLEQLGKRQALREGLRTEVRQAEEAT